MTNPTTPPTQTQTQTRQSRRRHEIEQAAQTLLIRDGYAGTTMSAVARQAGASMQTLYGWYGDKTGLYRALVARNADALHQMVTQALAADDPMAGLRWLGPKLITQLTDPLAVALNRAAAAEPGGTLGHALSAGGRARIMPLIARLMKRIDAAGGLTMPNLDEAADLWLALLLGDLQIRCVAGHQPPPGPNIARTRAEAALVALRRICPPR